MTKKAVHKGPKCGVATVIIFNGLIYFLTKHFSLPIIALQTNLHFFLNLKTRLEFLST